MTSPPKAGPARQRAKYSVEYKLEVVAHALSRPPNARIKPTCRSFPGIEPVQIRKWIKALAPLAVAQNMVLPDYTHYTPAARPASASALDEFSDTVSEALSEDTQPAARTRGPTPSSRARGARAQLSGLSAAFLPAYADDTTPSYIASAAAAHPAAALQPQPEAPCALLAETAWAAQELMFMKSALVRGQ